MNYRLLITVVLVCIMLLTIACTPKTAPSLQIPGSEQERIKESSESTITPKEGWEALWQKTMHAAQREGKVVLYGSSAAPAVRAIAPKFNKKFGIELEVIAMDKGAALTSKLFQERKAGLYMVDVILTGSNNYYGETRPGGAIDSLDGVLILPEVLDPKMWYGGKLPWADNLHGALMAYAFPNNTIAINTNLVKPDEIKSYYDLLNPKWKGKIIMNDPTISGVGIKSFSVLGFHILNLDYFRQLAKQEPVINRDQRLQVEWLAKEKYQVLFAPRPAPMMEFKRADAPVAYNPTPTEGTYLSVGGGAISPINKAAHPNAAKIFINWFLSKEGQGLVTSIEGAQSAREDVIPEGIDPILLRKPGVKYFVGSDSEEFIARDAEYSKAAQDIFGHLMR